MIASGSRAGTLAPAASGCARSREQLALGEHRQRRVASSAKPSSSGATVIAKRASLGRRGSSTSRRPSRGLQVGRLAAASISASRRPARIRGDQHAARIAARGSDCSAAPGSSPLRSSGSVGAGCSPIAMRLGAMRMAGAADFDALAAVESVAQRVRRQDTARPAAASAVRCRGGAARSVRWSAPRTARRGLRARLRRRPRSVLSPR